MRLEKPEFLKLLPELHFEGFDGSSFEDALRSFDFALISQKSEDKEFVGYVQVKELDKESAYMTYGANAKKFRGSGLGAISFREFSKELLKNYKRIGLATRGDNFAMLKMGLNEKFKIVGMRLVRRIPHVEMLREN